jgi:hypothetical protein
VKWFMFDSVMTKIDFELIDELNVKWFMFGYIHIKLCLESNYTNP